MFNFTSKTDKFGYTQATISINSVFYYIDFLPCGNRLIILCDSWLDIDKPKQEKLHLQSKYEVNY